MTRFRGLSRSPIKSVISSKAKRAAYGKVTNGTTLIITLYYGFPFVPL